MSASASSQQAPRRWFAAPGFICFALLMVGYLAVTLACGRFPNFDEVWYKCAGLDWAKNGTFAAHELAGFGGLNPGFDKVFGVYPPLYPFTFGVYTRLVGFGWRQVCLFDAGIHVLLCVCVALLVRHYSRSQLSVACWAAGASLLFVGTLGRPDELAMSLAIASVLAVGREPSLVRDALAGACFGLCAGTSASVAIVAGPTVALHLLLQQPLSPRSRIVSLARVGLTACLVFAIALVPVQLHVPGAFSQFFQLGKKFVAHGTFTELWLRFAWQFGKPHMVCALLSFSFLAALLPALWSRNRTLAIVSCLGPALGLLFVVLTMRGKFTYLWFVVPFLVAGAAAACRALWDVAPRWQRWSLVGAAGVVAAVCNSWGALREYVIVSMPAGQTWAAAAATLETVPDGAVVLTDEHWMTLGARCRVIDSHSTSPAALKNVEYVVLTSNMSSVPGARRRLTADLELVIARDFTTTQDHLSRSIPRLFGKKIFNSSYGFAPMIMKRTSTGAPAADADRVQAL